MDGAYLLIHRCWDSNWWGEKEIQRVDDSHGMALHFYVICICRRSSLIVCLVAHSATRYDMIWYGVAWATMIDILHSPEYFC